MKKNSAFADSTVLIIEDSKLLRNLLRDMLSAYKFKEVRSAPSAEQGLQMLRSVKPGVIMTDWLMEGMEGVEFVRTLRHNFPDPLRRTPTVMCTAYTDRKRIFTARDSGVDEILAKPITAARLYDTLYAAVFKTRNFIDMPTYAGPDRRRRQIEISFPNRRRKAAAGGADSILID